MTLSSMGSRLIHTDRWRADSIVGEGMFGMVQRVIQLDAKPEQIARNEQIRAAKIINLRNPVNIQEIVIHSELQHANIIQFIEAFPLVEHDCSLCIVMELAEYGNLWEVMESRNGPCAALQLPYRRSTWGLYPFVEIGARWIIQQIAFALQYMHAKRIYLRDLKPQNVLVTNFVTLDIGNGIKAKAPVAKICDFGYSKCETYAGAPVTVVGTPSFMPPELIDGANEPYHGAKVDAWACGVVLIMLLTGELPFTYVSEVNQNSVSTIMERIKHIDVIEPVNRLLADLSPSVQDLIHRLLQQRPEDRMDVDEMLQHPWMRENLPPNMAAWQERRLQEARMSHEQPQTSQERKLRAQRIQHMFYDLRERLGRSHPSSHQQLVL